MPFYRIPVHMTVASVSPEQALTTLQEYLRIYWTDGSESDTFADYGERFAKDPDLALRVLAGSFPEGLPVATEIMNGEISEISFDVLLSFVKNHKVQANA